MCAACNATPADLAGLVELTPEQYRQVEGTPLDNLADLARTLGATITAMLAVAEAVNLVANYLETTATALAKQRDRNNPTT